jgi:cell division protein FtsQ
VLLFGVFIAVGVLLVVQASEWLRRDDVLPVRTVAVEGASPDRANELRVYAGVPRGAPLFRVDLDEVAARVEEHPHVARAAVRRVPPDGLAIRVEERQAVAVVSADELYLVDDTGVPFKRAQPGDGLDLPLITGVERDAFGAQSPAHVERALEVVRGFAAAGAPTGELSEVFVGPGLRVEAVVGDGLRVVLGTSGFTDKLARLERVLAELQRRGERASEVFLDDERRPERVAVRLRVVPEMGRKPGG